MFNVARLRKLLLFGTPTALGILFIFHLRQFNEYSIRDVPTWTTVHVLQAPLIGLLVLSMIILVDTYLVDRERLIGRIGAWFFGVFFLTQEGVKGVGAAFLLRGGADVTIDQRQEILLPRVGDYSGDIVVIAFGVLASLGYLATMVILAKGLASHGVSMAPRIMLVLAGITGTFMANIHGGPFGIIPMLLLLIGVYWTETGEWRKSDASK